MVQDQGHKGQGRRSRSKVIGQGHRVKVKVVWGVLYPIESREVRHAGVCILQCNCLVTLEIVENIALPSMHITSHTLGILR